MKQLTVYDAIRTHARDVVRWQVREALYEYQRRLALPSYLYVGPPNERRRRSEAREKMRQRDAQKRGRQGKTALAELRANVRTAVLEVLGARARHGPLRLVK